MIYEWIRYKISWITLLQLKKRPSSPANLPAPTTPLSSKLSISLKSFSIDLISKSDSNINATFSNTFKGVESIEWFDNGDKGGNLSKGSFKSSKYLLFILVYD